MLCCSCAVKQYLPPNENSPVRRCRYDAENYVSTCPEHTKDWIIARKCAHNPASFVYEGGSLKESIEQSFHHGSSHLYNYEGVGTAHYTPSSQQNKFRNSYCASCNGVAWLGCNVRRSFLVSDDDAATFVKYSKDVKKYLFIYSIDFNSRSCTMDSDSALFYSNVDTGFDTCETMSRQLKQCDCQSVFDPQTKACVGVSSPNFSCLRNIIPEQKLLSLSKYAKNNCDGNVAYTPLSPTQARQACTFCSTNASANCFPVYEQLDFRLLTGYPSIHCTRDKIVSCKAPSANHLCAKSSGIVGEASSASGSRRGSKIVFLNAIAIAYASTSFNFKVHIDTISTDGFEQVFATFTKRLEKTCSVYSLVNKTSEDWIVCNSNQLFDVNKGVRYKDFLLRGDELRVCTEYTETVEFELQVHNYILSAISISSIIVL